MWERGVKNPWAPPWPMVTGTLGFLLVSPGWQFWSTLQEAALTVSAGRRPQAPSMVAPHHLTLPISFLPCFPRPLRVSDFGFGEGRLRHTVLGGNILSVVTQSNKTPVPCG